MVNWGFLDGNWVYWSWESFCEFMELFMTLWVGVLLMKDDLDKLVEMFVEVILGWWNICLSGIGVGKEIW